MGAHAAFNFIYRMAKLGLPEEDLNFLKDFVTNCRIKIGIRSSDDSPTSFKALLPNTIIMKSGQGTTTAANGLNSSETIVYSLVQVILALSDNALDPTHMGESVVKEMELYGFKCSLKVRQNWNYVEFLKCIWVPNIRGGYNFLPFLGRYLSMGMRRRNPCADTKSTHFSHAVSVALYQEARAGAAIPRNYPIIGDYLAYCDKYGSITPRSYKPAYGKFEWDGERMPPINTDLFSEMCLQEYGMTSEQLRKLMYVGNGTGYAIVNNPLAMKLYTHHYSEGEYTIADDPREEEVLSLFDDEEEELSESEDEYSAEEGLAPN